QATLCGLRSHLFQFPRHLFAHPPSRTSPAVWGATVSASEIPELAGSSKEESVAERYPIKLVRDRIRDVPNVHGGKIGIYAVGSTTRAKLLRAKLLEEVGEYLIDGGA